METKKDFLDELMKDEVPQKKESDFLKLKVGDTKLRVLTPFEKVEKLYKGDYPDNTYVKILTEDEAIPSGHSVKTEGWAWVIDRESGEAKILSAGRGLLKKMAELRASDEYSFDEYPMPYDITIKNTGEGPNRYSILPARSNTPVTEDELAKLDKKTPIAEIISKMVSKQDSPKEAPKAPQGTKSYPTEGSSLKDIPF